MYYFASETSLTALGAIAASACEGFLCDVGCATASLTAETCQRRFELECKSDSDAGSQVVWATRLAVASKDDLMRWCLSLSVVCRKTSGSKLNSIANMERKAPSSSAAELAAPAVGVARVTLQQFSSVRGLEVALEPGEHARTRTREHACSSLPLAHLAGVVHRSHPPSRAIVLLFR